MERKMEFIAEQLEEEESALEKMLEMERILDPGSFTQSDVKSGEISDADSDRETYTDEEEDVSLLVYTEEPMKEVQARCAGQLSREEVIRVSKDVRAKMLRRNNFNAFRLVANKESTALHEMNRVCATDFTMINRATLPLEGPLAILARCDDPKKSLKIDARTALERFKIFRTCNRAKLLAATKSVDLKLRVNYDNFYHQSIAICAASTSDHHSLC
ncbi:hypothetical protein PENTCL1PPCAC_8060 [Pristionchus entomophagus]|uniref:Uncharacterized protein n=1 Tax=Pristionchus entomophagus TaxID=358040 RepID=A0AAV5ST84_9BILA|nr:hypothetical protein PENTCL1PPCAC_8060 [Pristionchus entomophagus]